MVCYGSLSLIMVHDASGFGSETLAELMALRSEAAPEVLLRVMNKLHEDSLPRR